MRHPSHILGMVACLLALGATTGCARGSGGLGTDAGPRPGLDSSAPGGGGGTTDAWVPGEDAGSIPDEDAGATDAGWSELCVGVSCTELDTACTMGVCDPATGACVEVPRPEGTGCDDGNPCSTADHCSGGVCVAGAPVDCTAFDGPCSRGSCDPTTGSCVATTLDDGASCDSDPTDCVTQTCRAGTCSSVPAADCSSCGTGSDGVCAGGTCGAPPTVLAYGFESGLPPGWTTSGDQPWVVDGSRVFAGSMAAHSGAIGADGTSSLSTTVVLARPAAVSYRLNVSTEATYDVLRVLVDGVVRDQLWSGTWGWTQSAVIVPAGTHTIEWRYSKDGSINGGSDRVWIDEVRIEPLPVSEGFEGGTLPAAFGTSTTSGWVVDTSSARTGGFAAHSGAIGHSSSSVLWRWVDLPAGGNLSFAYRVSTESCCDYLELWVDGTRLNRWAGNIAWTTASFPLAAGYHFVEWRYVKDGSVNGGSDRVWIDDVQTSEVTSSGPLCGG